MNGAHCKLNALCYKPGSQKGNRNEEQKSSSSRVVQRGRTHVENDGEGQSWRYENRQGIEAFTRRNECDGSKARGVARYSWMTLHTQWLMLLIKCP